MQLLLPATQGKSVVGCCMVLRDLNPEPKVANPDFSSSFFQDVRGDAPDFFFLKQD